MVPIKDIQTIRALVEKSHLLPQIIFKHSLLCPISRKAHDRLRLFFDRDYFHMLIVQDSSVLKIIVAEMFDVKHESPQVIIFDKGDVVYHADHRAINAESVQQILDAFTK